MRETKWIFYPPEVTLDSLKGETNVDRSHMRGDAIKFAEANGYPVDLISTFTDFSGMIVAFRLAKLD